MSLSGRRIVLTRPEGQAAALAEMLRRAGAEVIDLPALEIAPLARYEVLDAALERLPEFDLVAFVSANAVEAASTRAKAIGHDGLRAIRMAAAPGPGTAVALAAARIANVIAPSERFDSEGIIDALQAAGIAARHVLILRGTDGDEDAGDGREALAEALRVRGATVECVASYRRRVPRQDPARIAELSRGGAPDAIVITSARGAANLAALLGEAGMAWVARARVYVTHPRVAAAVAAAGFGPVRQVAAGDAGISAALNEDFKAVTA